MSNTTISAAIAASNEKNGTGEAKPLKWEAGEGLGPRMAKQLNDVLSKLRWSAQGFQTLRGIIGKPETETGCGEMDGVCVSMSICGGKDNYHPEFNAKLVALQSVHGHVATKANYKTLIDELMKLNAWFAANPQIKDERITQEEHDKKEADLAAANASYEAKRNAEKFAQGKHLAELRAKYPWAKQDGSDHARLAANLKQLLGGIFPGVQFYAKSEVASMMTAVRLSWTNGPTEKQVAEHTSDAAYGHFNGMDDSFNHAQGAYGDAWRQHFGQTKYFTASRDTSEAREIVKSALLELSPEGFDKEQYGHHSVDQVAGRMLAMTGLPAGAVVTGAERVPDINAGSLEEFYRVTIEAGEVHQEQTPAQLASTANGIVVSLNKEKGGIEIRFPAKPDDATISRVKSAGFRWSRFSKCWWSKDSEYKRKRAYEIAGTGPEQANEPVNDCPDPGELAADRWNETQTEDRLHEMDVYTR